MNEEIDEIMDNFNFNRVHIAMTAVKWDWWEKGVPEIPDLRKMARKLLKKTIKEKGYVRSGGFEAVYEDGDLELLFVLDRYDVVLEDEKE